MKYDIDYLKQTIDIARESVRQGNHPFGALLVDEQGNVLITSGNTAKDDGGIGHAETNVARRACKTYSSAFLAKCTLVTSVEPCTMCSGTIYWAGIGAVVYGMDETRLAQLTGNNPENPTQNLSCRTVFAAGQRPVEVRGPYPELEDEIAADHRHFW